MYNITCFVGNVTCIIRHILLMRFSVGHGSIEDTDKNKLMTATSGGSSGVGYGDFIHPIITSLFVRGGGITILVI